MFKTLYILLGIGVLWALLSAMFHGGIIGIVLGLPMIIGFIILWYLIGLETIN